MYLTVNAKTNDGSNDKKTSFGIFLLPVFAQTILDLSSSSSVSDQFASLASIIIIYDVIKFHTVFPPFLVRQSKIEKKKKNIN